METLHWFCRPTFKENTNITKKKEKLKEKYIYQKSGLTLDTTACVFCFHLHSHGLVEMKKANRGFD